MSAPAAASEARNPPAGDSEREGLAALKRAAEALDEGENAQDEARRRRAYERASQEARRAVELLPENADAQFTLFGADGRLAELNGIGAVALALPSLNRQLEHVLELNPDHPAALAARGGMLMKLPWLLGGDTKEGVRTLEKAVSLNPEGAGTLLELAEAYKIVGREAEAVQAGRKAVTLARAKGETDKAERAARFVGELEESCADCPPATKAH